ncbi:GNAT family N-acetyltransferase [Cryobacterium tagatosivorans]|uniref:GNAT family N-acetyltransferase n=2 Tax=Cryobacterium tagatosivorans TaxID=1259199 RepID=A0A4R8UAZ4_9MICO|nr:GNAT family N-acetyltransferase [Cryobacterium tagatosivorans]
MTLAEFDLPAGAFTLRRAAAADVGAIVSLLADDQLRASVESAVPEARAPYDRAFEAINADPAQLLVVAVSPAGDVVATMQLTSIPGLARAGALRMQIEAVRVHSSLRGNGLGGAMIGWAIAEGRRRGARLVQLTSDQIRQAAHRFYERLGFEASHIGFKLTL